MAQVLEDQIWCCTDCLMIIANDDASGMDDETESRVRNSIANYSAYGYLTCGDGHEEFSHANCHICGALPGERHQLILMGD